MATHSDDPALEALRFPIGRFEAAESYSARDIAENVERLATGPKRLRHVLKGLSAEQLDSAYRPGGWSARQVVHHVADSGMNGTLRFRLTLTETEPTIKPYDENAWARLADAVSSPVEPSLELFESLTQRWVALLGTLKSADWSRRYFHPEHQKHFRLDTALALYAWHHEHHVAHISSLRSRAGWK